MDYVMIPVHVYIVMKHTIHVITNYMKIFLYTAWAALAV
jgi:hypothetical protein